MLDPEVAGAASVVARDKNQVGRFFAAFPLFAYLLVVFVVLQLTVPDMRANLFHIGKYELTPVELLYISTIIIAMAELLRVSKPGVDNTQEAIFMLLVWIVYLVLFVLGATGMLGLGIFSNTEFVVLTVTSLTQVIVAFLINARTLKRTIDYSGGPD